MALSLWLSVVNGTRERLDSTVAKNGEWYGWALC